MTRDPSSASSRETIAVLWSRFGPYHVARLRAAAEMSPDRRIVGLEIAGMDRQYEWSKTVGADGFERVTVFEQANYHDLSRREIVAGVSAALDEISPDAVAINGWSFPEARAALSWSRRNRRRTIVMSGTKADDCPRAWWKELTKRLMLRGVDAAMASGAPHADYIARLGVPPERIHLGYDVVDNDYFAARADAARRDAAARRAKHGLPNAYFFACTRFLPRKNVDGLLRAYALYRAQCSDEPWALVIAGSGEEEPALRRLARELGVHEEVVWAGFLQYPALPDYYALASAFVHAAKVEAWGLVVNEAAASALPLLVSRYVGAASELVRDGETGFLFDPFDDEDIARALTSVATADARTRARWGAAAQNCVSEWGPARFGSSLMSAVAT